MKDAGKTKTQLLEELAAMRQRIAELEVSEAERKQAQEEKEQIQAQLLRAQKLEAIGTLAGGVAHDFNNLLAIIQGHSELAMMDTDETHPLYSDLDTIYAAAVRAADLTRQLLPYRAGA